MFEGALGRGPASRGRVWLGAVISVGAREAREARVQGTMIVKCVIALSGLLENCRVIKPLPHMEEEVLSSLATRRYKPVTLDGQPLPVNYVFHIRLEMPQ